MKTATQRNFWRDGGGGVSVLGAFAIPVLIGFVGLVAEYGSGMVQQVENQRTADLAAYVAATYYTANGPGATALAKATTLAQNVAGLNGISASNVQVALVTSPGNASSKAINVNIATSAKLIVAAVIGAASTLQTYGHAYSQLGSTVSPCVVALSGSVNLTLSGNAALSAPACGLATNATVTAPCGTSVSAQSISYNTSAPSPPCSNIVASTETNAAVTDPLATNSAVTTALARLSTVEALTAPAAPAATGGGSIAFSWLFTALSELQAAGMGCSANLPLFTTTWTLTCPAGNYTFSSITIDPGYTLNFNTSGSASSTYNFSSTFNNSGNVINFGPGTYNFAQGLITSNGATTNFNSAGTFNFGSTGSSCNGGGTYSICDTATINFNGASVFALSKGVYVGGGATLVMGAGSTNSFTFGPSSDGNAIWTGGGSKMTMGDATGGSSVVQVDGNINITSGGSCFTMSAAAQHDINGYISTTGGTTLGAGVYTINGYFAAGANLGGSVYCNGSTVGVQATGVTIVFASAMIGGACNNIGFCVGNGYSPFNITAPTTGTTANFAIIGPQTGNPAGLLLTGGAGATTLSGVVYVPTGQFGISGGAAIVPGTGSCLQIVASTISLAYGTTTASTCITTSGTSTGVSMVQ